MIKNTVLFFVVGILSSLSFAQEGTASKQVHLLDTTFVFPAINDFEHRVWMYLPKDYDRSTKNYPVLYMHDGQNLFDDSASYISEWAVDESLDDLFDKTGKGYIVVGIENAGEQRINEYTPWSNEKYGGGHGVQYMQFIVDHLKPYIDNRFRTKKDAANTALIGSSLGGLISFYGGLQYPNIFGKIGAFSTSFWFSEKVNGFIKEKVKKAEIKIYLIVGGQEGYNMDSSNQEAYELILEHGFSKDNIFFKIDPEGKHNEAYWKNAFPAAIKWLFQ
jgi:alpha-glucosidase